MSRLTYLDKHNPALLKRAKKAYALTSYVNAMIRDAGLSTLNTMALLRQCKLAMNGYFKHVGPIIYMEHTDELAEIYTSLNDRFDVKITDVESAVFIEIILNLLPKKDMKDFLLLNFNSGCVLDADRMEMLVSTALELDKLLNELLGTHVTATKESLLKIFASKPKKVKKTRDKKVSKKQLAHLAEVEAIKASKERKKTFLQERIAKAKLLKDNT